MALVPMVVEQTGRGERSYDISGSSAGLTYGHVGIYIGDGKVIDNA